MNKDMVKEILYILIAILLSVIAVRFIIWLLPVILIGICSYYLYNKMRKNKVKRTNQNSTKTNKKIKIIDSEDI